MKKPNWMYKTLRIILRGIMNIFLNVTIEGRENFVTDEPVVIVSNHKSWLDPFFIIAYMPAISFGFMAEEVSALKAGWLQKLIQYTEINVVSVDRGNYKSRIKGFITAHKYVKNGNSFLIFPEGRFHCEDDEMHPFFMGGFSIAIKNDKKIVPIYIRGNERLYFRRRITVSIGQAIETHKGDDQEAVTRLVYHKLHDEIKPAKPINNHKNPKFDITHLFIGEMAEEYDTDDIIIRGNEAMKVFKDVNHKNS